MRYVLLIVIVFVLALTAMPNISKLYDTYLCREDRVACAFEHPEVLMGTKQYPNPVKDILGL